MSSGRWDAGYRLIDLIADKIYEERVARHNLHTAGSVCSAAVLQCVVIMQQRGAQAHCEHRASGHGSEVRQIVRSR